MTYYGRGSFFWKPTRPPRSVFVPPFSPYRVLRVSNAHLLSSKYLPTHTPSGKERRGTEENFGKWFLFASQTVVREDGIFSKSRKHPGWHTWVMGQNETTRNWTAGFSPWFHLPRNPCWGFTRFLTHGHLFTDSLGCFDVGAAAPRQPCNEHACEDPVPCVLSDWSNWEGPQAQRLRATDAPHIADVYPKFDFKGKHVWKKRKAGTWLSSSVMGICRVPLVSLQYFGASAVS